MFLLKKKQSKQTEVLKNIGIIQINSMDNYGDILKQYPNIYDDMLLSGAKFKNSSLDLVDDFYYGLTYCFSGDSIVFDGYFNDMFVQLKDDSIIENGIFGRVILNDNAVINAGEFNKMVEAVNNARINGGLFNGEVKIFHNSIIYNGEFNNNVYVYHPASIHGGKFNNTIYYIGLKDELKENKNMMNFIERELAKYWHTLIGEDFEVTSENYSVLKC